MEACFLLVNLRKGMQSSSEQPLVGEEHCVTTLIMAAKETMLSRAVPGNIDPRSFSSVTTVTTSGQYSPVRPSRSVSKRLVKINHVLLSS